VIIQKREEKRLQRGHLWVFSNEILRTEGDPVIGDVVDVLRYDGRRIGIGFYNPHSLIAVRMLSPGQEVIDPGFFARRIEAALRFRQSIYPNDTAFRLVHGESDGLPGLLIDVYGSTIVVQMLSAGMDRRTDMIVESLREVLAPSVIIARNESPLRTLEGLPQDLRVLHGSAEPLTVSEHGISYEVDLIGGQKTGMFLDQKDNRLAVRRYLAGKDVLDCFCNIGGFALNAAAAGANAIVGVDASETAIEAARRNMDRLGHAHATFEAADAFEVLERFQRDGRSFGGIILDPPAFTKNKRSVATALKAYRKLNMLALSIISPGGILVSASCSHHVTRDDFLDMLGESANRTGRPLRFLEVRGAAADHPVLPSMPETEYLKLAICSVD